MVFKLIDVVGISHQLTFNGENMVKIVTEKVFRPTIVLEDGAEYNICIPSKMRKYVELRNEDGKVTLSLRDCQRMKYNCVLSFKAKELLNHISGLAVKNRKEGCDNPCEMKTTLAYVENYGVSVKWEE